MPKSRSSRVRRRMRGCKSCNILFFNSPISFTYDLKHLHQFADLPVYSITVTRNKQVQFVRCSKFDLVYITSENLYSAIT